ncbi:MAG: STAS domain-containing protein [Halobacteriovoraceae bacterium]|nr:STAS domain-containing protein [Halobacteriovoraceae bacterium]
MSIHANILRDSLGNIVIQMKGDFNYENSDPLRSALQDIAESYPESKIKIDMSAMSFVGSSGISHFVETLKILHVKKSEPIHLSNVDQDFKRVFELYGLTNAMVLINNFKLETDTTENMNQEFGNRQRTFEN